MWNNIFSPATCWSSTAGHGIMKMGSKIWWKAEKCEWESEVRLQGSRMPFAFYTLSSNLLPTFLIVPTHFPHTFYILSSHFLYIFFIISTHFPHTLWTLSSFFLQTFLTLSTYYPHTLYTLSSYFPHTFYNHYSST